MMRAPSRAIPFCILLVTGVTGCGEPPSAREAFENLTVPVHALDGREVRLQDRRATLPNDEVDILLDDLHLTGTLDSPDRPVTAGILHVAGAAGIAATELVLAVQDEGRMSYLGSAPLGGRLRVEGIRYAEGNVILHLLEFAADDPPCCPSLPVQREFTVVGDEVLEVVEPDELDQAPDQANQARAPTSHPSPASVTPRTRRRHATGSFSR